MRPSERGALATAGLHLPSLSLRRRVCHPKTRTHVALLGPCFKTGRMRPFGHQRPQRKVRPASLRTRQTVGRPLTRSDHRGGTPGGSGPAAPRGGGSLRCSCERSRKLSSVASRNARRRAVSSPRERGATSPRRPPGPGATAAGRLPAEVQIGRRAPSDRRNQPHSLRTAPTSLEPDREPLQPHSFPS